MKFRKKPIVIEARQYTGGASSADMRQWVEGSSYHEGRLFIHTLEGNMEAMPGDWIIRGVKGEFYPCKPDIFAATYEEAD
jgi:hypothetical protein